MSILAPWNEPYSPQDERQAVEEYAEAADKLEDYGRAYLALRRAARDAMAWRRNDHAMFNALEEALWSFRTTLADSNDYLKAKEIVADNNNPKNIPLTDEWVEENSEPLMED